MPRVKKAARPESEACLGCGEPCPFAFCDTCAPACIEVARYTYCRSSDYYDGDDTTKADCPIRSSKYRNGLPMFGPRAVAGRLEL